MRKNNLSPLFHSLTVQHGRQNGFTLIELLVVISIIAVLAGLLMANFVGIRQRGRDAERKSEMRQIQAALEFYRSDTGVYPTSDFPSSCDQPLRSSSNTVYMQEVPCDPLVSTGTPYSYTSDGTTYSMRACLENSNDAERDSSGSVITLGCYTPFTLTNP